MEDGFVPAASADRWALSNPPVLALAPLRMSLELFARAGVGVRQAKSRLLTGFLEYLLKGASGGGVRIITPQPGAGPMPARGCQLSLRVVGEGERSARGVLNRLKREGVVCDFREPDVIRAAPVPLYNSFEDVWRLGSVLRGA